MLAKKKKSSLNQRFRGFLPLVVDLETSGLHPGKNGILEIALVSLRWNDGKISLGETFAVNVEPFAGAIIDDESLAITNIDPTQPLRYALPELQALHQCFIFMEDLLKKTGCQKIVIVGHNAWFDLAFLKAGARRAGFTRLPFHQFTVFDTATLAGVFLGETVLARAVKEAKIPFNIEAAHEAIYDARKTAELFCKLVNQVQ